MISISVISAEINFWNARFKNLECIYDQLKDERVRKMAVILEKTDSAYFPCFMTLFKNIVGGECDPFYSSSILRACRLAWNLGPDVWIPPMRPLPQVTSAGGRCSSSPRNPEGPMGRPQKIFLQKNWF
jgi:hypothetical protein